jgi:hypothetical protein
MLLIIAFALFLLIISAWVVAPTAAPARRQEPALPAGLPAMGSRAA